MSPDDVKVADVEPVVGAPDPEDAPKSRKKPTVGVQPQTEDEIPEGGK